MEYIRIGSENVEKRGIGKRPRLVLRGKSVRKGEDVFRIVEVANGGKKRRSAYAAGDVTRL